MTFIAVHRQFVVLTFFNVTRKLEEHSLCLGQDKTRQCNEEPLLGQTVHDAVENHFQQVAASNQQTAAASETMCNNKNKNNESLAGRAGRFHVLTHLESLQVCSVISSNHHLMILISISFWILPSLFAFNTFAQARR